MDPNKSDDSNVDESNMIVDNENMELSELTKKTWNVYGVSALFDCQMEDETELKNYGKLMRERLALRLPSENCTYVAKFSVPERFEHPTVPNIPRPLTITIHTKRGDNEKELYCGILLCWGAQRLAADFGNAVVLPVLLCRGTANTIKLAHEVLTQLFDCVIQPMEFSTHELHWIMTMALQQYDENTDNLVTLDYSIPEHSLRNELFMRLRIGDVLRIIQKIPNWNKERLTDKNVDTLMKILTYQISNHAGFEVNRLVLRRILLPNLTLLNNKFKTTKNEMMDQLLSYFHSKSVKELYNTIAHLRIEE